MGGFILYKYWYKEPTMPSVLIPKYPMGQITNNFFGRSQKTTISQFISDNYTNANGSIAAGNPTNPIQPSIPNSLLNSIMTDYGTGPISNGMNSLELINRNVISGNQVNSDIFGNTIIYGAGVDFSTVTAADGRTIVLGNLSMLQIINVVPTDMQTDYFKIIDSIVTDLKAGKYKTTNYSTSLLRQSRNLAQAASRIVNNGTNI